MLEPDKLKAAGDALKDGAAKAAEKARQRGEAAAKLSDAEEEWLTLSAEYEEGMAG